MTTPLANTELLAGFEAGTLAPSDFHHADHVHVAWLLLRERPVLEVLDRFSAGLRRLAGAAGKPGLYHETVTWAYVMLIHERMARDGLESWEGFAAQNPDLLTWKPSVDSRVVPRSSFRSFSWRAEVGREQSRIQPVAVESGTVFD